MQVTASLQAYSDLVIAFHFSPSSLGDHAASFVIEFSRDEVAKVRKVCTHTMLHCCICVNSRHNSEQCSSCTVYLSSRAVPGLCPRLCCSGGCAGHWCLCGCPSHSGERGVGVGVGVEVVRTCMWVCLRGCACVWGWVGGWVHIRTYVRSCGCAYDTTVTCAQSSQLECALSLTSSQCYGHPVSLQRLYQPVSHLSLGQLPQLYCQRHQ